MLLILDYFLQLILDYFLQLIFEHFLQLIFDYFLSKYVTADYFQFECVVTPTFCQLKCLAEWPHPVMTEKGWRQTAVPLKSEPAGDCIERI